MITTEISTWKTLRPGSIINLKDLQTLKELIGTNESVNNGVDLVVKECTTYPHEIATLIFIETDHDKLDVIVKIINEDLQIFVVFKPGDIFHGTRAELIADGVLWLFKEPPDVENFRPGDLEYSDEITNTYNGETVVFYAPLPTVFISKMAQFVQIREWYCEQDVENPYLFVFEVGGVDSNGETLPDGGWVAFYQGAIVSPSDITLFPV